MNTRTNIVLDDELVAEAMVRAGVKTKKAAVEAALRAYVRKPNYAALLAAEGSHLVAEDYDPKACMPAPEKSGANRRGSRAAERRAKPAVRASAPPRRKKR